MNDDDRRSLRRAALRSWRVLAILLVALAAVRYSTAAAQLAIVEGPDFGTISVGVVDGLTLSATGGSGAYVWTISAGALPPGLSIRTDVPSSFPASATAALTGVAITPGTYSFTLRVTSGTDLVEKICTITVTSLVVEDGPKLPDAFVGAPLSYALTSQRNGTAVASVWTAVNGVPPGMTLTPDGVLSGMPSTAGQYELSLTAANAGDVVSQSVEIDVAGVSIATPAELPDATANVPYSTTISAVGGVPPYSFASNGLPSGLTLNPSGALSGVLAAGSPRAVFTVTATDSAGASYGKTMSLQLAGTPPALVPASIADCTFGAACSRAVQLASHGLSPVSWTVTGLPAGMDFRFGDGRTSSAVGPGNLELWGAPVQSGMFPIQVTATDSNSVAASNTYTLTVSVLAIVDELPDGMTNVPYSARIRVLGGRSEPDLGNPAPDGASLYTVAQVGGQLPTGVVFDPAALRLSGTPIAAGTFTPVFSITDLSQQPLRAGLPFSIGASPAPTVGLVSPASGPTAGGTSVTISGTGFFAGAAVSVGGRSAININVVNATTITAVTPPGSAGQASIVVANPDGQSGTATAGFLYIVPPAITSVTPASGPAAGGTSLTIRGSNFTAGAAVTVGGVSAASVTVVNSGTITAVTPAGAGGAAPVTVTNADGQSATLAAAFTYVPAPAVASVTPAVGPISGGTVVTIAGTNFLAGATVAFGTASATSVTVVNATTMTATTPAGSAGVATVTVTNPDGQKGSRAAAFTYVAQPTLTGVSPGSGPIAGGTTLTITGTNFSAGSTVNLSGTPATNVTVVSATSITAVTPALREGATDVTVVNALGQSATRVNGFNYVAPAPTVTAVTPASGPTSGGIPITISGANFAATGTTADMLIDLNTTDQVGTTVTPTIMANGTIGTYSGPWSASTTPLPGFTVGAHRTNRASPVTVGGVVYPIDHASKSIAIDHTYGLRTISFDFPSGHQAATMAGFITFGPPKVTLSTAKLFDYWVIFAVSGDYAVLQLNNGDHGNYALNIETNYGGTKHTPDLIITPGATYWCVLNADFKAGTANLNVYETAGWTLVGSVTSTTVAIGQSLGFVRIGNNEVGTAAGTTSYIENVIVNYTNGTTSLAPMGTGAIVNVGANVATAVSVVNPTTITATTPAGTAGASTVSVTNPDGLSGTRAAGFTYVTAPAVTSVAPASGPTAGGTPITITGAGFVAGAGVTVGGAAATGVNVVNATTITAITPAGAAGPAAVTVTNPGGQAGTGVNAFTFVAPPSIGVIAPASGSTLGGTVLTISGTNFVTGATVKVGGSAASSVTVLNSTTITATTPPGVAGAAPVSVTNPDGQSATGATPFTYVVPPVVTSVSPSSGPTAGGTALTIGGSGFVAGATVKVGSSAATAVTVISSTTITATTPPGPASVVSVTVTNPDGQAGTRANGFTYVAPPTVSSVTPTSGPATGGTVLTIAGSNFAAGAAVTIGPNAASNVTVMNPTTLTAVTPAVPAGAQTVTVINPDGQSASLAGGFTAQQTDVALFGSLTARDSGVAIANASIKLCVPANVLQSGGACTALTTTDANGLYSLNAAQLGTGITSGALLFQASGFYAALQPFAIVAPPVQVNATALRGGVVIHGSVTDAASHDGIVGATVAFTLDSPSISADGQQPISVVTSTMGAYDVDSSHFMESAANGFSVTAASAGSVSAPGYKTFTIPAFGAALPYPQVENFPLTPAGPVVAVTVGTSPSGAAFAVDGLNYTASRAFSWPVDSIHTLTVASPQSNSTSIFTFSAWSDNGALSHQVTVTAGVNAYTAAFDAQYLLTTSVTPPSGGSITPGGWFNAGAIVSIAATSNPSYQFTGFSGALSGVTTPQSLTMNAAASVVANFATTNLAPSITSAATATFDVVTSRTFTVTATGSPAPSLSESGPLPAGVTFDPPSGVLGGTPASGTSGTYNITFVAANGVAPNAVQNFTLIVNPPYLTSLSLNSSSVVGGVTNATGTVTLDAPGEGTTAVRTVALSSSNPAAATVPASVTVATGATTATFTVTTQAVATTATTTVTATLGAQTRSVVLTVTPAPQVSGLTLTPTSVVGGVANATATVTLSGPAAGTTAQRTVTLTSSNTGAATVPTSVTVATGASSANFTVTSLAVNAVAAPVITATLGASVSATLTVNPLTVAQVTLNPTAVTGGIVNSTGTVTLTAAAGGTTSQRTVTLSSDNPAAATVPATVTVSSGATTATFTVTSKAVAAAATATIAASMNGGTQSAILTVTPPPQVTGITLNPASVVGGSANSTATVTLSAPASGSSSQRTVALSSSNTAATVPSSVTVASGATTATFAVTSKVVTAAASATISATLNGSATAALSVTPHIVTQVTLNSAIVVGGTTNATGTVTLNAPAAGTTSQRTVTLSSSNTAAATVPSSVTVASGATTATFTVTSRQVTSPATVTITATMDGSTTAILTVNPLTVAQVTLSPAAVTGGAGNSTATVTLNAPATGNSAQRTVTLSSSNPAAATVPASVTVSTGATSATFTVTSKAVTTSTAVTITATQNGGSQSAVLTVN
jgi:hypothetical protein